ncbi:MAG: saccharopine dehydrogenase, partial [Saprospiraceae bacterium]|nr:saccharopine dehydrogenase [Saprospiraceae bacterium]
MKILLFGAGRSALFFVEYILHHSTTFNWKLSIADFNFNNIDEKLKQHP